jgi:adenylosuccinate lyase
MEDTSLYQSPFTTRYSSKEMSSIFSAKHQHLLWRLLWIALAKGEKALGLPITQEQIDSLKENLHNIDYDEIAQLEKKFRHDVMAHIHAFGNKCPEALPILHLGATSTFVTDNSQLIQIYEATKLLQIKLVQIIKNLSNFAEKTQNIPTLSWTHLQAAQPTTVGKRASLWLQDFVTDLMDMENYLDNFKFLGLKGATGTQASFTALFDGDPSKVLSLEQAVAKEMGFSHIYPIAGQTYPRKQDHKTLSLLSSIAVSAQKIATDIRLLAHMKEMEEPLHNSQIGSSAMPYKRNPMLCERVCGLSRFLITLSMNTPHTAANQWLERTLDDSSNRRLTLSEGFLCADGIADLLISITANIIVYPKIMEKHLNEELPFLASENILMAAVKKGKDRQKIHERLRIHSLAASHLIKIEGKEGDFLQRIQNDPEIALSLEDLKNICTPNFLLGRAKEQVTEYLQKEVYPLLKKYKHIQKQSPTTAL